MLEDILEVELHTISAIFILIAAIIPFYISIKLTDKRLKRLTSLLTIFTIIHGGYHILEIFGFAFLADNIVNPLSISILIVFGLSYLKLSREKDNAK